MTTIFKGFTLSQVFNGFLVGKQPDVSNRFQEQELNMIPVITGVTINNGTGFYSYPEEKNIYNNLITISKDGEYAGTPFYQNRDVILGGHSLGCLSDKLNKYTSLYIMSELELHKKSGYWKQGGVMGSVPLKRLVSTVISLPIKAITDTEPDWEYMEQYIKQIEKKAILLVKEKNEKDIVLLKELVGQEEGSDISEDVEFREFKLSSIFDIKSGRRITKSLQIEGNIPYVTAATENNGIDSYIGNPPFIDNNILTVNFFGNTYYHPYDVSYKDGTYGLKLLNDSYSSKEVYLYMKSVIEKTTLNLGSYSKMLTGNIMSDTKIILPVNKEMLELVPDWTTIEEYMKHIQQKYILLKEQNNIEEINNLLSVTGLTHASLALDSKDLV